MRNKWMLLSSTVGLLILGWVIPSYAADGEALYNKHCKKCHAEDGKGKEKMLKALKVADKGADALSVIKKTSVDMSDDDMKKMILEGIKESKMKGIKDKLAPESDKGAMAIVAHVRKLQGKK